MTFPYFLKISLKLFIQPNQQNNTREQIHVTPMYLLSHFGYTAAYIMLYSHHYCATGNSSSVSNCARLKPVPSTSLSNVSSDAFTSHRSILP